MFILWWIICYEVLMFEFENDEVFWLYFKSLKVESFFLLLVEVMVEFWVWLLKCYFDVCVFCDLY